MTSSIPVLDGLRDLCADRDGLIIDLWGVLHDGSTAYPGVAEALAAIRAAGKRTLLLTNAPRLSAPLIATMDGMGLPRDLYDGILSSGDAVHAELQTRTDPAFAALGPRCWHLGPARDRSVFEGLDAITVVDTPEDADFVLNTGPWSFDETVADYEDRLTRCRARDLPMVCANPDREVIREGRKVICAGALAVRYTDLGGTVIERGKPDPAIYDRVLERLGITDRARVLAVGDGLQTDIKGAAAAGIDAVFVAGGLYAAPLGLTAYGERPDPARVAALCAAEGQAPLAAIPALRW
ncbi:TIGR01459 family HAD-type hydrolase [Roseospira marina]|uniref:TIGR01459 family HAD-type hydrolase n=1 Tax=Roseospira marina TaxID=140057 RepID=A0A5M6IDV4_9PROT|nr:TIGR01459 family HAD-type hydrolase [Roseospira marina]KAA5605939.1 TIGR01459 family HAD-type hydrolase [Roseospira marina]MBB4313218.1 HAD superfamily hydrolase (TIGR01459 family) [Roseospira marina]MBB5086041.1 HAD superfamily hydrolase (TIGR01459 family) [Roseospira marina]